MRLGGLEQWVMIRGEDASNPPLILLHGGPGLAETAFFRRFNAPLEQHFTVVYWEQRGAGRSYHPDLPRASMTIDRFVADLDELVAYVCARVGARRVALFGHSWGSVLGPLYCARAPEMVSVYVGCAQIGDAEAGEAASYAYALAEAERQGARAILRKLRAIGPPPHSVDDLMTERTCVARLDGYLRPKALWKMASAVLATPEASALDLFRNWRAFRFSLEAMWAKTSRLDLGRRVATLEVPAVFLLGRKDHWVPPSVSLCFIEALSAPEKRIVWFDESGHEPFVDEPQKFNQVMVEVVRPAC